MARLSPAVILQFCDISKALSPQLGSRPGPDAAQGTPLPPRQKCHQSEPLLEKCGAKSRGGSEFRGSQSLRLRDTFHPQSLRAFEVPSRPKHGDFRKPLLLETRRSQQEAHEKRTSSLQPRGSKIRKGNGFPQGLVSG